MSASFRSSIYASPTETDPNKRLRRQAKSKKYNDKHAPRLTEVSDQIFDLSDWDVRLPALPVAQSVAIIIGEITEARAFLSDDQTNVYSEFSVRVDEVLKNENKNPISLGKLLVLERKGGRVRFPSGKIAVSLVNHQDLPHTGKRYVLFLTHQFPLGGEIQDFYILTGYEFQGGRVFPLDKLPFGHPITTYKGRDETSFLTDLRVAINSAPITQTR